MSRKADCLLRYNAQYFVGRYQWVCCHHVWGEKVETVGSSKLLYLCAKLLDVMYYCENLRHK
jgi:hypothetical protein